jgi:hypothetical protein
MEFTHFRELEVVIVKLLTEFVPKSGFSGPENFSDIGAVSSVVADKISVEFARNWPCETPPKEDRIEDGHAQEVESA